MEFAESDNGKGNEKMLQGIFKIINYKIYKWLGICLLFFIFWSVDDNSQAATITEKQQIQSAVEANLSGKNYVKKVYYLDYDCNGRKEAFLLSGKKPENPEMLDDTTNTLWFGYCDNDTVYVEKIAKDISMYSPKVLKLKSASFFCAGEFCATSTPQTMYQVDGKSVKAIFQGDMINGYKGDSFTSVHSTYDRDLTEGISTGHTWKPYYFYYKNGKVYQYKAKKISVKKLKEYKGGEKYFKQIKKTGAKIASVYYRRNGLIHVNVEWHSEKYQSTSYENVTVQVKGDKVSLVVIYPKGKSIIEKSSYGGRYKKAL